jgi:hypothetical protein
VEALVGLDALRGLVEGLQHEALVLAHPLKQLDVGHMAQQGFAQLF